MILRELHVTGYRSVRDLELSLAGVNVLVGPNGCGKTNLYRALYLLHRAAEGRLAATLAEEGGMPSVLWAGERTTGPVRLTLKVQLDDLTYELSCGLPQPSRSAFALDPEVKEEHLWFTQNGKRVCLLKRDHGFVTARDADGNRATFTFWTPSESVLGELREPERFPVLTTLRQELLSWRFYHQFRTDAHSPLREPQPATRTPILSHDGRDLAAALQTIREMGNGDALEQALDRAFPGAQLILGPGAGPGRFGLALKLPEFLRDFSVRELSDGTLHYLCLLAALLSLRPPRLLALNEPEGSIHPDLLPALAELIALAGRDSQLWITTHSEPLARALASRPETKVVALEKHDGATRVAVNKRKR